MVVAFYNLFKKIKAILRRSAIEILITVALRFKQMTLEKMELNKIKTYICEWNVYEWMKHILTHFLKPR